MITVGLEIHGDVANVWFRERGEIVMHEIPVTALGDSLRAIYAAKDGTDDGDTVKPTPAGKPGKSVPDQLFDAVQAAAPKVLERLGALQDYRRRSRRGYV